MTAQALARVAFNEYTLALSALAFVRGAQPGLFDVADASARAKEWRGIWLACELEAARVRA